MESNQSSLHYKVPSWAGKPPPGSHLDVTKEGKLIQKLMIDEKKCYHFGRNPGLNDVCIDHQSCSRVHSALVYHKHLNRAFLVDLGSTHGTFIGTIRLEPHKPTQLSVNSTFHFGASTRYYTLRESPTVCSKTGSEGSSDNVEIGPLNLPESEMDIDNLTEFNTAHNKRILLTGIRPDDGKAKQRTVLVSFKEEEEIINPEDVDPSVGRFRNLMQTTVIPKKRIKLDSPMGHKESKSFHILKPRVDSSTPNPPSVSTIFSPSLSIKLGIPLPNPVPDVDLSNEPSDSNDGSVLENQQPTFSGPFPKKKKYAKEAWPGRKPGVM